MALALLSGTGVQGAPSHCPTCNAPTESIDSRFLPPPATFVGCSRETCSRGRDALGVIVEAQWLAAGQYAVTVAYDERHGGYDNATVYTHLERVPLDPKRHSFGNSIKTSARVIATRPR